jgi:hypothetical protein
MFCPITPQKRTPQHLDDALLKELSPFPQAPSHRKPHSLTLTLQLLASPLPATRDLFSQLLTEPTSALRCETMEEEPGESEPLDYHDSPSEEDSLDEIDEECSSSEGVRKRKRKSTAQIKVLKQELEEEANWSKEKIVEVSDLTGLSQSQVYKWWWDQKKKNARADRDALAKRKLIHKDFERRNYRERQEEACPEDSLVTTKVKASVDLEQHPDTERKVNKRLVFA